MSTVIVLVMHGMPPRDFPRAEMAEYFRQYDPFHHVSSHGGDHHHGPSRFLELDEKMKHWPRNPENDLFYGSAYKLAKQLEETSGCPVLVGFNEFCAPDLTETLDQAVARNPKTVVVITPMMTPGGIHSEVDIPDTIKAAKARHPHITFEYVWPYNMANVANFLHEQVTDRLTESAGKSNA